MDWPGLHRELGRERELEKEKEREKKRESEVWWVRNRERKKIKRERVRYGGREGEREVSTVRKRAKDCCFVQV